MTDFASPEKLVGIVGFAASGKDAVARILQEKHGYVHISLGDWLRRDLHDAGITPSRAVQSEVANHYRKEISPGYLIDCALAECETSSNERMILSGIYSPSEGDYMKNVLNGTLLGVSVGDQDNVAMRFQRLLRRADGSRDELSEEDFMLAHARESSGDYLGTNISTLLEMADYLIYNTTDYASLEQQVNRFAEGVGK